MALLLPTRNSTPHHPIEVTKPEKSIEKKKKSYYVRIVMAQFSFAKSVSNWFAQDSHWDPSLEVMLSSKSLIFSCSFSAYIQATLGSI